MPPPPSSPLWIAQRHGQDWRDEDTLRAIEWFIAQIPSADWSRRIGAVRTTFNRLKKDWCNDGTPLYDPADSIAWLFFQAHAYAAERENWVEEEAYRIVPIFRRIGQDLPLLAELDGAEERASRLLDDNRATPDDGLFEFLVALAYRRQDWQVAFVPELSGRARTPDLHVAKPRRRWAIECKRAGRSGYAVEERERGRTLARRVHALARSRNRSLLVDVRYDVELTAVPNDYLVERAEAFLRNPAREFWEDEIGAGVIGDVDWRMIQAVLGHDDLYFGASRMIELLRGEYDDRLDYSIDGIWKPSRRRRFFATSMRQASLVSWQSASFEAARRKASHFRSVVGRASGQLPGDRPGAIHVGYEARGGNSVDDFRHRLNALEMMTFDSGTSRLRWVYGNYMAPEHVTARNESAAASETTAMYRIGGTATPEPLPNHILLDDAPAQPGSHWRR